MIFLNWKGKCFMNVHDVKEDKFVYLTNKLQCVEFTLCGKLDCVLYIQEIVKDC